jgi:octaprenyl-diphosphate synthase
VEALESAARLLRSTSLRDIVRLIEGDLERVEAVFAEQVRSEVPLLAEMGRYIQQGGGKRIRPALLLLTSRLCKAPLDRAVELGAVVEFIHTATLLHDDIIDEATVRRGRRSVNSRWGNDLTVLAGDFLYTKSMAMALSQENLPILRLLSGVTLRMIEGEMLEIVLDSSLDVTEEQHVDLIRRKTADLFAACTSIGGVLGGASLEQVEALGSYGLNLGIAFQMVDDLLDFTADEKTLGKPVANDLSEGKLTLPAIFLLRRGGAEARRLVSSVLSERSMGEELRDEIVGLARKCGAIAQAQATAKRYADLARQDLATFGSSPYSDALLALPDFVLSRES